MGTLWQDIRYGSRMLARNPRFSGTVIAILALGIGTNTAVFSVINAAWFKPLPYYDEPDRIVEIWHQAKSLGMGRQQFNSSQWSLAYWREHNHVFEYIAGQENAPAFVTGLDKPRDLFGLAVSSCFFSVVGVQPALGRGFLPEEERAGSERVVILNHSLWQDHMGGDPRVIGKTLALDERSHTIVGVMPPGFRGPSISFWVPLVLNPDDRSTGTSVVARLKPGVSLHQAQAEMTVFQERLVDMDPERLGGKKIMVRTVADMRRESYGLQLRLLWGAAGLVLFVACANAAGLFLVHANAREREITVRAMLGAPCSRIVRQLLTQSVILGATAAGLGVLTGSWALQGFLRICPAPIPRISEARLDHSVLLLAAALGVLGGMAFSLIPAWRVSHVRLWEARKGRGTGPSMRCGTGRFHGSLIVAQIGIALTLLMCVGMSVRSLVAVGKLDLGFERKNVLIASIDLPLRQYPEQYQWRAFYEQLLEQVDHLPSVRSASLVCPGFRLSLGGAFVHFSIEGHPLEQDGERPMTRVQMVSPGFIEAMGMQIVKGRSFSDRDMEDGARSVIINEALARRYFSTVDPLDERIDGLLAGGMPIVGVVRTIRDYDELNPAINTIYVLLSPHGFNYCSQADLIVRTAESCEPMIDVLRSRIAALDPTLEPFIEPLEVTLRDMLSTERFVAFLLGLFAHIAVILAAVGLYGLVQYALTQHTHEIGVRMALGATQSGIVQTVLRRGLGLVLLGTVLGLLGGYVASRVMASLLYQSRPTDLVMLAGTIGTLLVVTLVACYLPARRAARIDPMVALRYE